MIPENPKRDSILWLFGPAVVASLMASALGFVFWVVAARFFSTEQLGSSGPMISLASAIGIASAGGLYAVFLRVFPVHDRPRRLLWAATIGAAGLAMVVGAGAGLLHLSHSHFPHLTLTLAVAAGFWSIFTMQDSILLSLRKTKVLFASNVGFGLAKLVLLVVMAHSKYGIVTSWLVPLVLVVPAVAWVADRSMKQRVRQPGEPMRVTVQHVAAEYTASTASVAIVGGVPVVAALAGGAKFAGFAFVSWTLYTATDMVTTWLSNVIVSTAVEKGHDVDRALRQTRTALVPTLGLMLLGLILAPQILMIYGGKYAVDVDLLRILMFTLMIRVLFGLCLAARRIRRQYWRLAAAQCVTAVVALGGAAVVSSHHSLIGLGFVALAASLGGLGAAYSPGILSSLRPSAEPSES